MGVNPTLIRLSHETSSSWGAESPELETKRWAFEVQMVRHVKSSHVMSCQAMRYRAIGSASNSG